MLKAVNGGGGRGMRQVHDVTELAEAYARAASEAQVAFGDAQLYAAELLSEVRHVEVQIIGDGRANVKVVGDRDCSLQRRHQKILDSAPAPNLDEALRKSLWDAAQRLAQAANYRSLGTFEFLVTADAFYFMEANVRIQVEHTITEEAAGIDLVQAQLRLAQGESLDCLAVPTRTRYSILRG